MSEVRCTAVCGPRGGQAGWLPPKQVSEMPRQSHAPEVGMTSTVAPTKLSAGKSHCPYLCCLALPRDPRPGASSPGGADNLPEAVVTPYRSLRPQVFLTLPNCVCHITPSAQTTAQVSPNKLQPLPALFGRGTHTRGWSLKRDGAKTQTGHQGLRGREFPCVAPGAAD